MLAPAIETPAVGPHPGSLPRLDPASTAVAGATRRIARVPVRIPGLKVDPGDVAAAGGKRSAFRFALARSLPYPVQEKGLEGFFGMSDDKGGKMHSNLPDMRRTGEITHLQRMAAYYDKLGCVDVARSLRGLAAAKRKRDPANGKKIFESASRGL